MIDPDRRGLAADCPNTDYLGAYVVSLEEILATAPGPELGAGITMSDDEFDDFLRAARS